MKYLLSSLSIFILFSACSGPEFTYPEKLDGSWTISRSERMIIWNNGTVEHFEDIENAGTLLVYEPVPEAATLKEFVFTYTNYLGATAEFSSLLYSDEGGKRVSFSGVLCNSPFECDIVWTVEENSKNRQVWATYGDNQKFFYPPDRWDPTDEDGHLKWRITLTRN